MDEYLSRRSKTAAGFLRRGSGISSSNRNSEETTCHNTDGQGSTARVNPMKTRLADNEERPRYVHGSYKSASSKFMSGSSSKVPLRKFGEEKRRQSLLEGINIAESSRRKAEASGVEDSKKIVVEKKSSDDPQTEVKRFTAKDDQLVAPDPEVSPSAGSSGVPARTAEYLVRSASLNSKAHRQKDKEMNLRGPGYSCSSSFTSQPTIPRIPTVGAKPLHGLVNGEQIPGPHGLKNLGCTSASVVLPSGCSSDSVYNRRFAAMKKRASEGESSSSRSRVISGPSSLGHSHTIYPSISGPRIRSSDQSVSQQTLGSRSRNIQDSAVSVRTIRTSRDSRFRMSEERQDGMLSLHESTAGDSAVSARAHFSMEEVSSESSRRPFSVERPHAIYSSSRQGSSTRTARRTSSSHFAESRPQTSRGLLGERGAHRRINMEGIAEVLLALDRIGQETELTYEQLRVLEANLLLGAFASHDQHSDLRMDIDNMSYEELLELEERIGSVSTALSEEQFKKCIRRRLYRPVATVVNTSVVDDIKCSICQCPD
ncbi:unnamed protein product [Alopecurus aequalis]